LTGKHSHHGWEVNAEAEVTSLRLEIENLRNHNATLKEGSNPDEKSLLMQHEVVHVDGKYRFMVAVWGQ
jgi:hypothetical protein